MSPKRLTDTGAETLSCRRFAAPVLFCVVAGGAYEASDSDGWHSSAHGLQARPDVADFVIAFQLSASSGDRCRLRTSLQRYRWRRARHSSRATIGSDYRRRCDIEEIGRSDLGWSNSASVARRSSSGSTPSRMINCMLIWLLDYFRSYPKAVARLKLRLRRSQSDRRYTSKSLRKWQFAAVDVSNDRSRDGQPGLAGLSGSRRRKPGSICSSKDLSALPLLAAGRARAARRASFARDRAWRHGNADAGADRAGILRSRMRCFYPRSLRQRRVFSEWELGYLLEGLAHRSEAGDRRPRR